MLGPNLFFRMSYKVVALFMSEKTRRKATLLAGDEDLLEYIDVNCLLKVFILLLDRIMEEIVNLLMMKIMWKELIIKEMMNSIKKKLMNSTIN